jgi:uncharacterized protein
MTGDGVPSEVGPRGVEPTEAPVAVVLDSNVLIAAAFRPGSDSGRIVDAVRSGRLRLVWDEATRRESEALFRRIPPISWDAVGDLFVEEGHFGGEVVPADFPVVPDPDDRKFAALAAASGAVLVTADAALLRATRQRLPKAAAPGEFARRLGPG